MNRALNFGFLFNELNCPNEAKQYKVAMFGLTQNTFQPNGFAMPNEYYKCKKTGDVYENQRLHGRGCPFHTDLKKNGGNATPTSLLNYYQDTADGRRNYPNGRYSCSFCKQHQETIEGKIPSGGTGCLMLVCFSAIAVTLVYLIAG